MSGYDGYSKSNNAIRAEDEGKMTATSLAKVLRCSSAAVKAILSPTEWHHTSNRYNRTNYYHEPVLLYLVDGDFTPEFEDEAVTGDSEFNLENIWNCLAEHAAELKELRSYQSGIETLAAKAKILVKEWGGTRNRPKCYETEYMVTNLRRKTLPGTGRYGMGDQWYIWTDSHGKETRKKDTNFIKWEAI